jgi:hypothetical protein
MRCEVCQGQRTIRTSVYDPEMPCAACGGLGEVNCCDGICEQPEDNSREDSVTDPSVRSSKVGA